MPRSVTYYYVRNSPIISQGRKLRMRAPRGVTKDARKKILSDVARTGLLYECSGVPVMSIHHYR